MKIIILTIFLLPIFSKAQDFKRNTFDYSTIKTDTISVCVQPILEKLEESITNSFSNNSRLGLKLSKEIFDQNNGCPDVYIAYGLGLFKSGEWLEGVEIIEDGIYKFGSIEALIRAKSSMSLEMAYLGTQEKNIDGNSVFKSSFYNFNEEQFIEENFKSALKDYQYLAQQSNNSSDYIAVAKILQELKDYQQSNDILKRLVNDDETGLYAKYTISENYIFMKKYTEAESILNELYALAPNSEILEDLATVYGEMGLTDKETLFRKKANFYSIIPDGSVLNFSDENYNLIELFANNESSANQKINKLEEIENIKNLDFTIDLCLAILKLHANHGNGVEEKATEILKKYSSKSISKVNEMFQADDVSTCSITNLAEVMAVEKNTESWELMKAYLNYIPNMPSTIIPPRIPENMIKFDEDKALTEILLVVKNLSDKPVKDNVFNFLGSSDYIFYSALKKVKKSKVITQAKELGFTNTELKKLEQELK